jgi:hypothetical protein
MALYSMTDDERFLAPTVIMEGISTGHRTTTQMSNAACSRERVHPDKPKAREPLPPWNY